ncbi:MAG: methenyltetrahydromethanopterin cyclohydrolase [Candidatus Bathyarchaeia archaeon]
MLSVNKLAFRLIKTLIDDHERLGVKVIKLRNGAKIIDAGIEALGSLEAGIKISEISLGGLAKVSVLPTSYNGTTLLSTYVSTDSPSIAIFGSQLPLLSLFKIDDYSAIISGPGKTLIRELDPRSKELFEKIQYKDSSKVAIFILQTDRIPNENIAKYLAKQCRVMLKNLYLIVTPTNSVVGSIQVSARMLEITLWRLLNVLKFSPNKIIAASGSAPISPVYPEIWRRLGITPDDMLMNGSRVVLLIKPEKDDDLEYLTKNMVIEASRAYGKSFYEMLKEADFDFYKVDHSSVAPAQIVIYDFLSGKIHEAGKLNIDLIKRIASQSLN